jgi:hypothetical protein
MDATPRPVGPVLLQTITLYGLLDETLIKRASSRYQSTDSCFKGHSRMGISKVLPIGRTGNSHNT